MRFCSFPQEVILSKVIRPTFCSYIACSPRDVIEYMIAPHTAGRMSSSDIITPFEYEGILLNCFASKTSDAPSIESALPASTSEWSMLRLMLSDGGIDRTKRLYCFEDAIRTINFAVIVALEIFL
jgi:hypothetical protein